MVRGVGSTQHGTPIEAGDQAGAQHHLMELLEPS